MTKQEILEKLNKAYDRDNEDYKETADTWCLGSTHAYKMAIELVKQLEETSTEGRKNNEYIRRKMSVLRFSTAHNGRKPGRGR